MAAESYKGRVARKSRQGFQFGADTHPHTKSSKAKRVGKKAVSSKLDQEGVPSDVSDGLDEDDERRMGPADDQDDDADNDGSSSDGLEDVAGGDTEEDGGEDDTGAQPRSQHIMNQQQSLKQKHPMTQRVGGFQNTNKAWRYCKSVWR